MKNESRPLRVLLDANVLISYLLVPQQSAISQIVAAAYEGLYTLLAPEQLLDEVVDTVRSKPRLSKRIPLDQAKELATFIGAVAEVPPPLLPSDRVPAISRDPKDDYLLAHAIVGQADYLVTGDDDLLSLGEVVGLKIVRPAEFQALLQSSSEQ